LFPPPVRASKANGGKSGPRWEWGSLDGNDPTERARVGWDPSMRADTLGLINRSRLP
jgi:hypothetical protein